jgi:hypothetical protein
MTVATTPNHHHRGLSDVMLFALSMLDKVSPIPAFRRNEMGQALALFLAIHHQTALTGKPIVTLPARLLTDLGVNRDAKARGLRALEQAGLVYVSRSKGKAARIELRKSSEGELK